MNRKNLQHHALIIFVVIAAVLLRTWALNTSMIFYGDAAQDLTNAVTAVQTHSLPLLGIASSVPRFHQGPLSVWIEMLTTVIFGPHLLVYGFVYALLSIFAVVFLYEIVAMSSPAHHKRAGAIAAFFLAFSPLAIAHGRVPFHTTAIPLFLILYLFLLIRFWQKKPWGLFWAVLGFCLLFQFELANLPLVLLIPYVAWRTRTRRDFNLKAVAAQAGGALVLGLLPEILFDLTHNFAQLGGFAVWVVYRCVAFLGYRQDHSFSLQHLWGTVGYFATYLGRVWSVDNIFIAIGCLIVFLYGGALIGKSILGKKRVLPIFELGLIGTVLLTIAYFIHGSPSEAYFPPFFVFSSLLITFAGETLLNLRARPVLSYVFTAFMVLYAFVNVVQIWQTNFFVSTKASFNYGPGIAEQRLVVGTLLQLTHGHVQFATAQSAGQFPSYFANFRWILKEKNAPEDPNGQIFYIEPKGSNLQLLQSFDQIQFTSVDAYHIMGSRP